jgi:hypothetical protein
MTSEEFGAVVFGLGYLALLIGAIRVFGLRRVVFFLLGVVFLGVVVAMKSLAVMTGSRRY